MRIDFTEGNPWKNIVRFMLPMLLGNIAQQLYNTADSIIVGRYVGDDALAAVGSTGSILNLLIVLLVGISNGAAIVVAQYQGAKEREKIAGAIGNSLVLITLASLCVMGLSLVLIRPILVWMGSPAELLDWSASYLRIMLLGCAGLAYYNMMSGLLRGLGDAMSALIYLLVACALNIFLDIFFITRLDLGVAGVAYATILAQAISALLCLNRLLHMHDSFDLYWQSFHWEWVYVKEIIRLGIPSGLTQVIMSMSFVLVQSLINSFGATFMATCAVIMRVDGFVCLPALSFGSALTTFAGQNHGAGRPDRVEKGLHQSCLIAGATGVLMTALLLLFGRPIMSLFTETETILLLGTRMMRILAVGYIMFFLTQCLCGTMAGEGKPIATTIIAVTATFAIRLPLAYLLGRLTGAPESIYISQLAAWVLGTFLSWFMYRRMHRRQVSNSGLGTQS